MDIQNFIIKLQGTCSSFVYFNKQPLSHGQTALFSTSTWNPSFSHTKMKRYSFARHIYSKMLHVLVTYSSKYLILYLKKKISDFFFSYCVEYLVL